MRNRDRDLECIEPGLGGQLWRLDDPTTATSMRERLNVHVAHCAACRAERAMMAAVADGLASGELSVPSGRSAGRVWRRWNWTAAATLAAGLALMLLLPPTAPDQGKYRGTDDPVPVIERPVSGEVVVSRNPRVRWTAIEDATAYQVTLRAEDGAYEWTGRVATNEHVVPDDAPLPADTRFRVNVVPVPGHLMATGGLRSAFRTGTW